LQALQGSLLQLVREIQDDLEVKDCPFHLGPNRSVQQGLIPYQPLPSHMRNLSLNSTVVVIRHPVQLIFQDYQPCDYKK